MISLLDNSSFSATQWLVHRSPPSEAAPPKFWHTKLFAKLPVFDSRQANHDDETVKLLSTGHDKTLSSWVCFYLSSMQAPRDAN